MGTKVFEAAEEDVVAGVGCTWCGVGVGEVCLTRDRKGGLAHAQRWRDLWNATHDRHEHLDVSRAHWLHAS